MNMTGFYIKKLIIFILLLLSWELLFATDNADSLKQSPIAMIRQVDSLKKQLQLTVADSLKGALYTQIASQYLKFDTIRNKKLRYEYQEAAISNTMSAIHYYSRFNDTTGLRISFDNLAKVYHAQKKYPQAKWFILQSNTLAREKNDRPNIINSLLELASIKSDIKDYTLAMRDLNEALQLSSKNHLPQLESRVQLGYAMLYTSMKNPVKSAIALKRHLAIDDSIKKAEEALLAARIRTADSSQQVKKKDYMNSSRGPYIARYSAKPGTLPFLSLSSF